MKIERLLTAALLIAPAMLGQNGEIGGLGGYAFTRDSTATGRTASASTGFRNGFVVGAFGGSNDYRFVSGEASYLYRKSDLKLSDNSREVSFAGHTHFVDLRILVHFSPRGSAVRPFVAVGTGFAVYSGTGRESASQPLNNLVALTRTREIKPMVSGAAGVKVRLSKHIGLRVEFRDYSTPFPNRLIAPAPGVSIGGWVHNFVPMVGISGLF